jgi:hypothetical protein
MDYGVTQIAQAIAPIFFPENGRAWQATAPFYSENSTMKGPSPPQEGSILLSAYLH